MMPTRKSAVWTTCASVALSFAALNALAVWQPGLWGGFHTSGATGYATPPTYTNVFADCHAATNYVSSTSAHANWVPIWSSTRCWQYWGQIRLPAGTHTFAAKIDDNSQLIIDGTTLITQSGNTLKTATFTAAEEGWYDFSFKCGNGSGGAGPYGGSGVGVKTNNCPIGFGVKWNGAGSYVWLADYGTMSRFRHDDGNGFPDEITFTGEPFNVAVPGVSYATVSGLVDGETYTYTVPSGATVFADGSRAICTGWRLYAIDPATGAGTLSASDNTATASFQHAAGDIWRLVWLWRIEHLVAATAYAGGTVAPAEQWVVAGATATVTATPDATHGFYKWTNDVPASVAPTDTTISFPVSAPASLFATFGNVLYVAENGDDGHDGSSPQNAFATIEKAVASAAEGTSILVCPGQYRLASDRVTISTPLSIVGQGNDPEDVIIRPKATTAPAYLFTLSHQYARLKNLTLSDGKTGSANNETGAQAPALIVNSGTAANCIIRNCSGAGYYGAVKIFGGIVEDCVITNNAMTKPGNANYGHGGGVTMLGGGTLRNCLVAHNSCFRSGAGVCMTGSGNNYSPRVTGCTIANNGFYYLNDAQPYGGAGVAISAGILEKSVIVNNTITRSAGAGVALREAPLYGKNGTPVVRNCLVVGNSSYGEGGGVWMDRGSLYNCTIVGNAADGLRQTAGTAMNNVVFGNGSCEIRSSGGTCASNVTDDPLFADAANGDYSLSFGSPAIDAATALSDVAEDFAGVARPQGSTPDCGAWEFIPCTLADPLAVAIAAASATVKAGGPAVLSATLSKAGSSTAYSWDFDSDGTVDSTEASPTIPSMTAGVHAVCLTVTQDGETATATRAIRALPATNYVVEANANAAWPYATRATAAANLQDAIDAVWAEDGGDRGVVIVADGTYEAPSGAMWTRVVRNVEVKSENGPGATILHPAPGSGSNRRVLFVGHGSALVHGFTIKNGNWYSYTYGDTGGGGLRVSSGTVSNCILRANSGSDNGGALHLTGGLVTHCEIYGNTAYRGNNAAIAKGGAAYVTGGTLAFSVVTNNTSTSGSNLYISGGKVQDCLVADGRGKTTSSAGVGVYMTAGTVERCTIRDNGLVNPTYSKTGGGIWMSGGTLRNCLVTGNKVTLNGAGVYQTGGMVEFCTITANTSSGVTGSGLYINKNTAIARNNILYGNGAGVDSESICNVEYVSAASFATNIVVPATSGVGNIDDDPLFADAANGDYSLGVGSPAIDAASAVSSVTNDIAWNLRPKDGKGDRTPAWDIGCYEAASPDEGDLRCSFTQDATTGYGSATVTFTANAAGTGSSEAVVYTWDFGGGVAQTDATAAEVTVLFPDYGSYTVTLTATAGGQTATYSLADAVKVGSSTICVNGTGSGVWPYATPATATNDICEALNSALYSDAVQIEVIVADGDYPINEKWGVLSGKVRIHSANGPDATSFYGKNQGGTTKAGFFVNNADAVLEGVTVRDCSWDGNVSGTENGAVRINAGLVTNCVILRCRGGCDVGGGLDIRGGLVTDSVIVGCEASGNNNISKGRGGGVGLTGPGVLRNCVVTNNYSTLDGGGIYMTHSQALVTNCVVSRNWSARGGGIYNAKNKTFYTDATRVGGGVHMTAGTLANCRVTDNYGAQGGGIYAEGGTIVNCLVTGNASYAAYQGLYAKGSAKIVNCTFADNGVAPESGLTVDASAADATLGASTVSLINSIVWSPACATGLAPGSATVSHCCYASATEGANGNTARDPRFRAEARHLYELRGASPCIDAGDWTALDASPEAVRALLDLSGQPRLFGGQIDIGCFEKAIRRTMTVVR